MSERDLLPSEVSKPEAEGPVVNRSLDRSLASGIAWTAGMRSVTQAMQWAAALIVVRLLSPADYGLVGMATAYLGLARLLSEFGLSSAIVQHRGLSENQIGRLNVISVAFAVFFALVSIAGAPLLAAFFEEPAVETIVIALSVTFVFAGFDVVPRSLLRRDLDFRRLAWVQAAENLTYAVTSLALAALGQGYWSLVWGAIAGMFCRMAVALGMRFHPFVLPRRGLQSISAELWFGWHVVAARFAIYLRQFADIAIVGRLLGAAPLGVYNVAWTQANIPVDRVTTLVSEVTPSVFAAAQHDKAALRRYVRIITEGIAFLSFPATLGLAIIADDFVLFVFGERWQATIAPLRILALVGALRSITPILSQILIATEQAKKNMLFTVLSAIVIPVFLFIGARWGLTGVAFAWLIGHPLVMLPVLLPQALKAIDMRFSEYFSALRAAALACIAMMLAVVAVRMAMPADWPLALRLLVEVAIGAVVYGLGMLSTYRSRLAVFYELLRSARRKGRPAAGVAGAAPPGDGA